jgi:fatty-acyl-CoA synthase
MENISPSVSGILKVIVDNYNKTPEKLVVGVGKDKLSYNTLINKGDKVAASLYEMGIRRGDRVGLLTQNSVNWYVFLYGVLRLGAIPVPFDPQIAEHEIRYLFDKIGIRVILVMPSFRGLNHKKIIYGLRDVLPDLRKIIVDDECDISDFYLPFQSLFESDACILDQVALFAEREDSNIFFCTTGSTGNPKIVDLPCRITDDNIVQNAEHWGFEEGDKFLLSMPLYHCAGFGWGLSCLSAGGSTYYEEGFSPTTYLETIQRERITKLLMTPTIAKILLTHPRFNEYDISSLNEVVFTGEYLADELANKFINEMNIRVVNALGMTETFVFLDWNSTKVQGSTPNSFMPTPGVEIKVVDENGRECKPNEKGLIHIKNSTMKGYFRLKEITDATLQKDGWLNSGDLGKISEDGRISFVGREKRVIKRGGNLVAPEEIEQFLRTHEACAGVIVDKEEDKVIGEKIIAYFQTADGFHVDSHNLREFCKGRISSYKIPDEFYFVKEIPKTVGKANPTLLRKLKSEINLVTSSGG